MGVKLENIVPWGRSLDEYIRMFNLTPDEQKLSILDCGGGPASFNAEMTQAGYTVISCDPIYQFSQREIAQRVQEIYPVIVEATKASQDNFVWQDFTTDISRGGNGSAPVSSPEELGQVRMATMSKFLQDFPQGKQEGRYLTEELPHLPFNLGQFDLALCSHLLFTYSDQLSFEFHLASITEMCRVAREVRIFPLLTHFSGELSPHLPPVTDELHSQGYTVEIQPVPYEFQRNGNQLLRVLAK